MSFWQSEHVASTRGMHDGRISFYVSITCMQVDPIQPGEMSVVEFTSESHFAVLPTWSHIQNDGIASICMLENVMASNRERLYRSMCSAILCHAPIWEKPEQKVPFEVVRVPGDGRCGWRALLAAQDVTGFSAVPRRLWFMHTC